MRYVLMDKAKLKQYAVGCGRYIKIHWKTIVLSAVTAGVGFLFLLYSLIKVGALGQLPGELQLTSIKHPTSSLIYDAHGRVINKYFIQDRTDIQYGDLPDHLVEALLSTEDHRFYTHHGVDYRSLLRVTVKTILLQQDASGGGSTLSQQIVKNIFPRKKYKVLSSVINKWREMIIAKSLERYYSKHELIVLYLNTVSFGERAFGLQTAAQRFFRCTVQKLSIIEAATLIGMLKAPSYYSPRRFPERAKQRRNVVMSQMKKYGYLNQRTLDSLLQLPLAINYNSPSDQVSQSLYIKQLVKQEFDRWNDTLDVPHQIYQDGLKIFSTIDLDLQGVAESAIHTHLPILQEQFSDSWAGGKPYGTDNRVIDDAILKHPKYSSLRESGLSANDIIKHFTVKSDRKIWSWHGDEHRSMTIIDSIKHELSLLHAAMLVTEVKTGKIKALIGGNNDHRYPLNHVQEPRQVGSTFKPIAYLTALENGIAPCSYYDNELRSYVDYDDWTPKNANGEYGGSMSLINALVHSVNTVSVQVLLDAGISAVVNMAQRLGIESHIPEVPSIVLGTADVSLYEMMGVYSTIANGGISSHIHIIDRIENQQGDTLYQYMSEASDTIVKVNNAYTMIEMLKRVSQKGTGRRINQYSIPFEVAGKTGTTQNQSDGWYIGAGPELAAGAWVGTLDRRMHFRYLSQGSGSNTALPIVGKFFESAAREDLLHKQASWTYQQDSLAKLFDCPATSEFRAERMNEWLLQREHQSDFSNFIDDLLGRKRKADDRKYRSKKSIFDIFKNRESKRKRHYRLQKDRDRLSRRKRKNKS